MFEPAVVSAPVASSTTHAPSVDRDGMAESSWPLVRSALVPHWRQKYEPLAASEDFCIGSAGEGADGSDGAHDCERVQFVSGLTLEHGALGAAEHGARGESGGGAAPALLLSYGVNDCEARVARIPVERVWRLLRPLAGVAAACVPQPAS